MELELLDAKEVARRFGLSKAGIFNLVKKGIFPAGVKIGHSRRWSSFEIADWLEAKRQNDERRNNQYA